MNILVCVFHPNIAESRVNKRWIEAVTDDPQSSAGRGSGGCFEQAAITIHEVYRCYPNWSLDIKAEQQRMEECDRIVFQHPFQWYSVPPLMKKWLDEVLDYGWAYGSGGTALVGKEWLSAISTGATAESYQLGGSNGYGIGEFLKPLQQTAVLVGMNFLPPFIFHGAMQASTEEIEASAEKFRTYIKDPTLSPKIQRKKLLEAMS